MPDTRDKRGFLTGLPFIPAPPTPDGDISAEDRAHLAGVYPAVYTASYTPITGGIAAYSGLSGTMALVGEFMLKAKPTGLWATASRPATTWE